MTLTSGYYFQHELREDLLDTLIATQVKRPFELNLLLRSVFLEGRYQAGSFTLDGFESVPEYALTDEPEPKSTIAVVGKLIASWVLPRRKSPDHADYKVVTVLPYKCWLDTEDDLVLVQDFPQSEQTRALLLIAVPTVVRNKKVFAKLTDGILTATPEERIYFGVELFDKLMPEAVNDLEKIRNIFELIERGGGTEEAQKLLDEHSYPMRKAIYDKMYEIQKLLGLPKTEPAPPASRKKLHEPLQ